jgi:hypothetical protein
MAKGKKKRRRAKNPNVVVENIYQLDGRVPLGRAIPYGLQHVLAMFVANLTPITIIAAAAVPTIDGKQLGYLIQNAMFIAGIATLLQLYPIWRIGSRLPIVKGVSFTFVTALSTIGSLNLEHAVLDAPTLCGEGLQLGTAPAIGCLTIPEKLPAFALFLFGEHVVCCRYGNRCCHCFLVLCRCRQYSQHHHCEYNLFHCFIILVFRYIEIPSFRYDDMFVIPLRRYNGITTKGLFNPSYRNLPILCAEAFR